MSVIDWQILDDLKTTLEGIAAIKTAVTTVCDSSVDVPASGFPAALVLWRETVEKPSGVDTDELTGRVHFYISLLVRDSDSSRALQSALTLADDVRDAVLVDPTRSGLASATAHVFSTEVGPATIVKDRRPPVLEVRLSGSCGYYVSGRGD